MIKVVWLLRRAEHLTLTEFKEWLLRIHAPDVIADQHPYMKAYTIDLRADDDCGLLPGPPIEGLGWDGIAVQWFDTAEDYNAVYGRVERPTRADTLKHTSALQRLILEEHRLISLDDR